MTHQKDGGESRYDSMECHDSGNGRLRTFKKLLLHKSNQENWQKFNKINFFRPELWKLPKACKNVPSRRMAESLDSIELDHVYFNPSCQSHFRFKDTNRLKVKV